MMFVEWNRLTGTTVCAVAALTIGMAGSPAGAVDRAAPPPATSAVDADRCRSPVNFAPLGATGAQVTRFDVGNHESGEKVRYDRLVVGLSRPAQSYQVRYVPAVVHDGTGETVSLRGNADIGVVVRYASAHDDNGVSTVPERRHLPDWGALREARIVSDWEGYVTIGLGVTEQVDFTVATLANPDRLVIDLAMPDEHPWTCTSGAVRVFFFNEPRYLKNVEPFFTPVWRRVLTPAVARGALTSLLDGPVAGEGETGLRLLRSGVTGIAGLSIQNGVARVYLEGGCDAGGSTVSIAGSIVPILKQFSNVQFVKIYDSAGQTADPSGTTDSIPDCLNP